MTQFDIIYADPPWSFKPWKKEGGSGRLPQDKYPCLSLRELAKMGKLVQQISKPNSVLMMWGVWRSLPQILNIMEDWGFKYKTNAFVWVKMKNGKPQWGTGYYTRANTEFVLLGTRGRLPRSSRGVHEIIMEERTVHSRKPEITYFKMDELYEEYRDRVELFASSYSAGIARTYDFLPLGLEVTGNDIRADLEEIIDGRE